MSKQARISPTPIDSVLDSLDAVAQSAHGYVARCPAHDDRRLSLSIDETANGIVLIHCHAGCSCKEVVAAIGLRKSDLFPSAAMYPYEDEKGRLIYQVIRYPNKRFRVRSTNASGSWRWSMEGVRRVLYRVPEVLSAIEREQTILVTEGEKDLETCSSIVGSSRTRVLRSPRKFAFTL
jgi:putative DNA primase/helicase